MDPGKGTHLPGTSEAVVQQIRALNPPGCFLKKDPETGLWWEIGDKDAVRKVAQALRESVPEKEEWEMYQRNAQTSVGVFSQPTSEKRYSNTALASAFTTAQQDAFTSVQPNESVQAGGIFILKKHCKMLTTVGYF